MMAIASRNHAACKETRSHARRLRMDSVRIRPSFVKMGAMGLILMEFDTVGWLAVPAQVIEVF